MPLGELSALGSALLWAINGVLLKPVAVRIPALRITAIQYSFAALLFLAIALPLGKGEGALQIPPGQAFGLIAGAVIGMAGGDTSYVRSLGLIGVARSYPLATSGYIFLAFLLAVVFLGEPITPLSLAGAATLLAGIWLVVRSSSPLAVPPPVPDPVSAVPEQGGPAQPSGKQPPASSQDPRVPPLPAPGSFVAGLVFAGVAAVCWAVTTTILKLALEGVDVLSANLFRLPLVAVVLTALSLRVHGREVASFGWKPVLQAGLAGVVGIGVGSIFFLYAVQEAGAARTAVLSSTSPLFAAALSAMFLGERLTFALAAGVVLSVAGVWMVAS